MQTVDEEEVIRACRYCFMCRYACPTFLATKRESVTPRGYALQLMMIQEGKQAWTNDIVSAFYQCSLCGLGAEDCEYHWPEDEMVRHARETIVGAGLAPQAAMSAASAMLDNGKPWPSATSLPKARLGAEVLYITGCQARANHPEIIAATGGALSALGVDWGVLARESCCGGGLYDLGFTAEANRTAQSLAAQIAQVSPKTIVTGCAHCYRTLKVLFPARGVDLPSDTRVLHTAEYLNMMRAEGRLRLDGRGEGASLGYHDPCMLGRKMGVYQDPRALIHAAIGSAPVELFHNRELAECCGAGAATFLVEPAVAQRVGRMRMERAADASVSVLVTACQNCKTLLQGAEGGSKIEVMDISELVVRHLA